MVNEAETAADRRERPREGAVGGSVFGQTRLNPFGDLHTLQHLSARFAKSLKTMFEPMLRQDVRSFAEPLSVQRFGDYRAERGDTLSAWLPLAMPGGPALAVFDGRFVLELLDLFFGGTGQPPAVMPTELSPSAESLVARLGAGIVVPLTAAWEPVARIAFAAGRVEPSPAMLAAAEDAMVVTRFGIAPGDRRPAFIDILYPVAALKPHGALLTGKVVEKVEPDPAWRHQLTRAAMGVRFPVRSVLAEPVVPLSMLMNLKVGDVIPISFGADVPVMVGRDRLGSGTVGTSNGHAAVRLTSLARFDEGQDQ